VPRVGDPPSDTSPQGLLARGIRRVTDFCALNGLAIPAVAAVGVGEWHFSACAYYRPTYIKICLPRCARPAVVDQVRNWNWPGSVIDRTPYGVVCHELGHHADYCASEKKSRYGGDYSIGLRKGSGEAALTGYCPDDWEFMAEMFRVFVTNPALLARVRPVTYELLCRRWRPLDYLTGPDDWLSVLGPGVPDRVVRSLRNKMAAGARR
jgi:hypothetical protein